MCRVHVFRIVKVSGSFLHELLSGTLWVAQEHMITMCVWSLYSAYLILKSLLLNAMMIGHRCLHVSRVIVYIMLHTWQCHEPHSSGLKQCWLCASYARMWFAVHYFRKSNSCCLLCGHFIIVEMHTLQCKQSLAKIQSMKITLTTRACSVLLGSAFHGRWEQFDLRGGS